MNKQQATTVLSFTLLLIGKSQCFVPLQSAASFLRTRELAFRGEDRTSAGIIQPNKTLESLDFLAGCEVATNMGLPVINDVEACGCRTKIACKVRDIVKSTLEGSKNIYTFATIRDFVRKNPAMDWSHEEMIITQGETDCEELDFRFLKRPVRSREIIKFIKNEQNWKNLMKNPELAGSADLQDLKVIAGLPADKRPDVEVVEFDDKFHTQSLVYGIAVNKKEKRISVVFRGSVMDGRDWPTNLNAILRLVEPRSVNSPIDTLELSEKIRVHSGFREYLYAPPQGHRKFKKFDQIVLNLKELFSKEEYKDFDLFITGHSLGGALTQLLAFELGISGALKGVYDAPITAISFASPQVGNKGYREAFQQLEKKNIVHHIRFSNSGDFVPVASLLPGFGYTQTGLHCHIKKEDNFMEIGYNNIKDFLSQLKKWPLDPLGNHDVEEYFHLVEREEMMAFFADETITDLYTKYWSD